MSDERPDINAVLEHYGSLTKDRTSYATNCPFHEDRTPSCSINTERQLFNCKSCGKSGDSYSLIMEKEETDFRGAQAFAATLGLATGVAGGGDGDLSGGYYSGRRRSAKGKRDRQGHSAYVPAWRRR